MKRSLLIEKFDPDYTNGRGDYYWRNKKKQLHSRGDRPAVITSNGLMYWYKNGEIHRDDDKPAIIYSDGGMEWWKNGNFLKGTQVF